MILDNEGATRLAAAIFTQLRKDYMHDFDKNPMSIIKMETYIKEHPLTSENSEYIIANLRNAAKERVRIRGRTHRVRVGKVEV